MEYNRLAVHPWCSADLYEIHIWMITVDCLIFSSFLKVSLNDKFTRFFMRSFFCSQFLKSSFIKSILRFRDCFRYISSTFLELYCIFVYIYYFVITKCVFNCPYMFVNSNHGYPTSIFKITLSPNYITTLKWIKYSPTLSNQSTDCVNLFQ